jgi:hypothetical protein
MHDQQTYKSRSIMLLDERFSTSDTSLEFNGDANGDTDDTSNSYDTPK